MNSDKFKVLKFGHINCRSVLSGFHEFSTLVQNNNLDIVGISETWLSKDISNDHISMNGYNCYRCDRDGRGGGVAVFVNNHYNSSIISFGQGPSLEYIWLKVQLPKQKIAIGIFYRPPHSSVTEAGNTFDNMLPAILAEYDDIILSGDINVNLLLVCNSLTKCLDSYNLKQVISEPTRITESTLTLLDPIYLSKPESCLRSGTINADMITDHYLTFCDIRIALPKNQQKFVTFRDFHSLNEIA
ncbi:unnamed protein product [Acanthoscelides obtectus]|uniref:Endonuclease/exonuclease/phosphatase domain-containing protein n=1 Tax=Acanthoscelides obtectus TaxID=200917 RepID=A0A9P0LA36_ACAOB|nr:unnamed protein product [Acanthoscelides obtectus]CAK1651636.1 hypothetical protein AOBTE_LOCUS17369 [Acanthoscelides obtectus]